MSLISTRSISLDSTFKPPTTRANRPSSVVACSRMLSQAVDARSGLEIAYMGKGSTIAVATARSFGGATASRGPVIMVTDTVPVQLIENVS